jgi:hypothetical protein
MYRHIESKIHINVMLSLLEKQGISVVTELTVTGWNLATLSGMDAVQDRLSNSLVSRLKDQDSLGVPERRIWLKS